MYSSKSNKGNDSTGYSSEDYAEFKYNFRPINKHRCYFHIQARLVQLSENKKDFSLVRETLTEFKYLTKEEDSMTKLIDSEGIKDQAQDNIEKMLKILSQIFEKNLNTKISLGYHWNRLRNIFIDFQNQQNYFILSDFGCQNVSQIFSKIAKYVLLCHANDLGYGNNSNSISTIKICYSQDENPYCYSQQQILYLLCLMTLNLVPQQYYNKNQRLNKYFNKNFTFCQIFNNCKKKTHVVLDYFKKFSKIDYFIRQIESQVNAKEYHQKMSFKCQGFSKKQHSSKNSENYFVIKRKCIDYYQRESLLKSQKQMNTYTFLPNQSTMQNYIQLEKKTFAKKFKFSQKKLQSTIQRPKIQVDFANKYISGGALTHGMVQEEIIYMNHPELFVTVVLCQSMNYNEALYYEGFSKYYKNIGYGRNLVGFENQEQKIRQLNSKIIAIDAQDYRNVNYGETYQYQAKSINRQIIKAYAGFANTPINAEIITGNWGCGIFCGNHQLKFMIQWIAGSLAERLMIHCPYGKENKIFKRLEKEVFLNKIKDKPINFVYNTLLDACWTMANSRRENIDLLEQIYKLACKDEIKQKSNIQNKLVDSNISFQRSTIFQKPLNHNAFTSIKSATQVPLQAHYKSKQQNTNSLIDLENTIEEYLLSSSHQQFELNNNANFLLGQNYVNSQGCHPLIGQPFTDRNVHQFDGSSLKLKQTNNLMIDQGQEELQSSQKTLRFATMDISINNNKVQHANQKINPVFYEITTDPIKIQEEYSSLPHECKKCKASNSDSIPTKIKQQPNKKIEELDIIQINSDKSDQTFQNLTDESDQAFKPVAKNYPAQSIIDTLFKNKQKIEEENKLMIPD